MMSLDHSAKTERERWGVGMEVIAAAGVRINTVIGSFFPLVASLGCQAPRFAASTAHCTEATHEELQCIPSILGPLAQVAALLNT